MKTERRHELQRNQLADWLGHQVEQVRPHFNILLGVAVVCAAAIIVFFIYTRDRQSALENAWADFYMASAARDRDALESVAKLHSGTVVELCARQSQADLDLSTGIAALYTNRTEAYRSLDDAKKAYSEVVNGSSGFPELMQHSLFGLGQVSEAISNIDKAKEYYHQVVERFPQSPLAMQAQARLKELDNPQVVNWYNWFSRQQPKPNNPSSGLPNLPGMPQDLSKLPEDPDLPSFGNTPGETPPGTSAPSSDQKSPAEKTTDDKPSDTKASDEKPLDAKPSDAKPSDAKPSPSPEAPDAGEKTGAAAAQENKKSDGNASTAPKPEAKPDATEPPPAGSETPAPPSP